MTSPSTPPVRHRFRRRFLLAGWLLVSLIITARAARIQVIQRSHWQEIAQGQHEEASEVAAPRGTILDRNGNSLVSSNESFKVGVAPRELRADTREEVVALLASELGLSRKTTREISDPERKWVEIQPLFPPSIREPLAGIPGVYLTKEWKRSYPYEDLARGVLGTMLDGEGRGGIEGGYEDHLRGIPGQEIHARDNRGHPIPGQSFIVSPPVSGGDVILTLDRDLQEIGHEALAAAVKKSEARGGDLIVSDPETGEILTMVSIQAGNSAALSAINSPYEPGSTLKPFTVAGILSHSVATLADSVDGEDGMWQVGGRLLTDTRAHGKMTLAEALKVSSNVGVAKMAQGLTPAQQYQTLRDFGFGSRTGIELSGEASGALPHPSDWTLPSPSALAIGYEISVTPVQMAMAYGALANGGKLMEPRLVKELRGPEQETLFQSEPRVVRKALPESTAWEISQVLVDVVQDGTGTQAQLGDFEVAGKSGTTRAYGPSGYERGKYYASFVCFFPVEDPQLVVFVKLDRPKGDYYGGLAAAPVTRATLEAVLAARQAPIDRGALVPPDRRQPRTSPSSGAHFASSTPTSSPPVRTPRTPSSKPETGTVVPDVSGLPPRLAVRRLHALGFRVRLEAQGSVSGTDPSPGTTLSVGDTVRILSRKVGDG
jgi:cell division protein FtsI (penicillin-binding protein 3)